MATTPKRAAVRSDVLRATEELLSGGASWAELGIERIEIEQAAGKAPASPAGATAFALVWMTERTFYQQVVQEPPFSRDELVEALVGVWMRGVYG